MMYLSFITERFSSDPFFVSPIGGDTIPREVKLWIATELYRGTDWFYDYADGPAYLIGKRSVNIFQQAMKLMFPDDVDRKEVLSTIDTKGVAYGI